MNLEIIDNFLKIEDISMLSKFFKKKRINENGLVIDKITNANLVSKLDNNYHERAIEILKKLYPKKVDLYEYTQYVIVESGCDFKFPIHDDDPNKILSGVIYLEPEKNTGTKFYSSKKGQNPKEIEWKTNRAVFFSRKEGESWHSYEGNGMNNRIVLVYNLMTKNIKKVYEIENKNYWIGLIRWKLNPYLYRYLKFII